jgi:hypothetical protein
MGLFRILMPSPAKKASKEPVNLVSRSRMRKVAALRCESHKDHHAG